MTHYRKASALPVHNEGLVIAHLGQGIAVEHENSIILCQPLRRLETVAVGDKVKWSLIGTEQGRIEEVLPRRSLLARPARNNKIRPVAANIDKVFVVFAKEPGCDFLLIDQYLAVCENSQIAVALILNKIDLGQSEAIEKELLDYQQLGYDIHRISVKNELGLANLKTVLRGQSSILTGQSGVGKSSLTNAIIPDKQLKTNTISETTKHGRHTTTAATLYRIDPDSCLIDSPGVAIFGLADLTIGQLAQGYREFQDFLPHCKFNDCRHVNDMGCAVRNAVNANKISSSRYKRYLKLIEKMHH